MRHTAGVLMTTTPEIGFASPPSTSPFSRGRIMRAREEREVGREVAWPADQVERWPLTKLIPYARNARTHSDEQVAQIAASIREWGWTVPVLVDEEGTLIAGHGRVLAAQLLGITDVPTMVARGGGNQAIGQSRKLAGALARHSDSGLPRRGG
jgi:hypothetical protein